MPTERLSMRHIREVLRLHHSVGMSQRSVARSLGLAQGTVSKYLNRTRRAGLTSPLPPELDDDVRLEHRLYPPPSDLPSDDRPQPDWAVVHRELRRPSVTLMLLWEEYCDTTPRSPYLSPTRAREALMMAGAGGACFLLVELLVAEFRGDDGGRWARRLLLSYRVDG